jgi:hypothetical protein
MTGTFNNLIIHSFLTSDENIKFITGSLETFWPRFDTFISV